MSDAAHSRTAVVLPVLLFLFGAAAQAQPAFRVKDLNTTGSEGIGSEYSPNTYWDSSVAMGEIVYFGASDGIHGFELWRSDGTPAGTRLAADVCPGSCASLPRNLTVAGGKVFFLADDGFHGPELWTSDGTPAGTAQVKDLVPPGKLSTSIHGLAELNGKLLFAVSPYGLRHQLWRTDGTAAGTVLIAEFEPDTDSIILEPKARVGGKLFFAARSSEHGKEIWSTDGTTAGTVMLKDINPGPSGSVPGYLEKTAVVSGGRLFFLAIGPEGFEPWVSDGTRAGTTLVKDVIPGPASFFIGELTAWGKEVFFFASPNGQGRELWRSDGTAAGTRSLQSVPEKSSFLTLAGGRLFFFAECELWTSDGTGAGTALVTEIGTGSGYCDQPFPLTKEGGKFLFFANDGIHGKELWQSDGTQVGTSLVSDFNPGVTSSVGYQGVVVAGGRWYFRAKSGEDVGTQFWTTDGTAAGTRMLLINRQRSAFHVDSRGGLVGPRALFDLNGTLLFQGGEGATGAELSRSDGTAAGTRVIKDLRPGTNSSLPGEITRAGKTVFFRTGAGTGIEKLWKTDGTAGGTQELFSPFHLHFAGLFSPRDLTPLGESLLFAGSWWEDFTEALMKSDGTPEGTTPIEATAWVSHLTSMVRLNSNLALFQGDEELWRSDGTEAGTAPIGTAPAIPYPRTLAAVSAVRDGVLLFAGITPGSGDELWRSDGTEAGTYLLAETVPGPGSKPLGPFARVGQTVFFAAGGDELWKNDASGTRLIRKLPPGDPAIGIRSLTTLGNKAYFTYHDNARGNELWRSDGTQAGTLMLKDIQPGPGSSHPRQLHVEGSTLLFSASDGPHGFEPWRSNGARWGTRMIQDIAPGSLSSNPTEFTASGPNVYFAANDGTSGFELWAIPRP